MMGYTIVTRSKSRAKKSDLHSQPLPAPKRIRKPKPKPKPSSKIIPKPDPKLEIDPFAYDWNQCEPEKTMLPWWSAPLFDHDQDQDRWQQEVKLLDVEEHKSMTLAGSQKTFRGIFNLTDQIFLPKDIEWVLISYTCSGEIMTTTIGHETDPRCELHGYGKEDKDNRASSFTLTLPNVHFIHKILISESCASKRYYFLPLNIWVKDAESGHLASLVFDKTRSEVCLLDPNGSTGFFGVSSYPIIDKLLKVLVEPIDYKVMSLDYWNLENLVVNRHILFNDHCVVITVLMIHLLYLFQEEIPVMYKKLAKLGDGELSYLLSIYAASQGRKILGT